MSHYKDPYKPTDRFTPREINGWNLKVTFLKRKVFFGVYQNESPTKWYLYEVDPYFVAVTQDSVGDYRIS